MKFLMADDHAIFRSGLKPVLVQLDPSSVVLEADDYLSALDCVRRNPDLDMVLLDLLMPGMPPFDGLKAVREAAPQIPVVVVSMIEKRQDVFRAIDMGALGYIPKSLMPEEFIRALRQVLNGDIFLPSALLARSDSAAVGVPRPLHDEVAGERLSALTKRQREVVGLIGRGMTNSEIARQLGLSESTVRLHVSTILDRLDLSNRTQVALLVVKAGEQDAFDARPSGD